MRYGNNVTMEYFKLLGMRYGCANASAQITSMSLLVNWKAVFLSLYLSPYSQFTLIYFTLHLPNFEIHYSVPEVDLRPPQNRRSSL